MSASTIPTVRPALARARARLTVTDDLPTPPLPLAIAKTFVSEPGWANGISRWACPSRSTSWRPARCSAVITPRLRSTPVMPSMPPTAAVTSRLMVSLRGQPATVSSTVRCATPASSISTESTMPRSVMGRLISGSLTVASAALTCSRLGVLMIPNPRRWGVALGARLHLVVAGPVELLEVAHQRAELGAQEVAGRDLAHRHPQRRHLAGQELHVGVGPRVGLAVLLGDDLVARLLPVLREQDQGSGVRRLQAEHQRQEDERVVVEAQVLRRQEVPADPDQHEGRHVDQEPRSPHEAGELLREDAEGVGVVRRPPHQGAAGLLGGVEAVAGRAGLAHGLTPGRASPGRRACSRQFSGSMWSSRSSTVTAPSSRPLSSTTGAATRLYVARWAATCSIDAAGRSGSMELSR